MKTFFLTLFLSLGLICSVHAYQPAVVSAHKEATLIGVEVLKKGGNAADAAIATAFALGVVEPHNSGMGGGGFLLYYDAKSKKFHFLDYRETAPKAVSKLANPEMLQKGIHSVGVPGFVLGMEDAHKRLGSLPWKDLVMPSVNLAKKGVTISGMLQQKVQEHKELLSNDPVFKSEWLDKTSPDLTVLANSLSEIAEEGSAPFYQGSIAQKLVDYMSSQGGLISLDDLKNYRTLWRKPFQFEKDKYTIVSSGSPSAGGAALSLLFRKAIIYKAHHHFPNSGDAYSMLLEGVKDYFDYRAAALGDSSANIIGHTTHLNVIDEEGNIAAMTNTINSPFGSGLIASDTGIILNNELADFSTDPRSPNKPLPGKRPLSSMSPTIVMIKNKPILAIGTPGGLTIPQNLFQVLYAHWNWKSTLAAAIAQPKVYYSPSDKSLIVEEKLPSRVLKKLEEKYTIATKPYVGNVQALVIKNERMTQTLSDPRGEGSGIVLKIAKKVKEEEIAEKTKE